MNLKESNRWVKKAQTIPWLEIEKRYTALFTNRKGNAAKPLRLALGTCIIQAEYGYSDEEITLQICQSNITATKFDLFNNYFAEICQQSNSVDLFLSTELLFSHFNYPDI